MEYRFSLLTAYPDVLRVGQRLLEENSMWALEPSVENITAELWADAVSAPDTAVIEGYINGEAAGVELIRPFCPISQCGFYAGVGYRKFFKQGVALARKGMLFFFAHYDCKSLIAQVPVTNRHIFRIARELGFIPLSEERIPGLMWYGKKKKFVDGRLFLVTEHSLKQAEGGY